VLPIIEIRDQLNDLVFKDGKRQVELGDVSELFDGEDVDHAVECLEQEQQTHDLELVREGDKRVVVQRLKRRPQDYSWLYQGIQWASRITTISAEMVVPGLLGFRLDDLLGTGFLALIGFGVGVAVGIWHLTLIAKSLKKEEN